MPQVAPLTKYNQIIGSINERLRTGNSVTASDEFWFNSLKRDAEKLLKVDAAQGHIALAALMQLKWDEEKALHHIKCANAANPSLETRIQEVALMSNFGRFSYGLALLDDIVDPRNGVFAANYLAAMSCGAFHRLAVNQRKAVEMNIDLSGLPISAIDKATNILSAAGVSDEKTAQALDVAGEILRDRKQFWIGESVEVEVDDTPGHQPTVFFTFLVNTTPETASSMTFDLYKRLLKADPDYSPSLNLGFRSATIA
jgi:hypothetical protein